MGFHFSSWSFSFFSSCFPFQFSCPAVSFLNLFLFFHILSIYGYVFPLYIFWAFSYSIWTYFYTSVKNLLKIFFKRYLKTVYIYIFMYMNVFKIRDNILFHMDEYIFIWHVKIFFHFTWIYLSHFKTIFITFKIIKQNISFQIWKSHV